jgi:hypothetical protein
MAFNWYEYLELARLLQGQLPIRGSQEAAFRSAISRAYFGAFGFVRNYARDHLGFQPRQDPDDHGRLRAFLKKGKTRKLASQLDRLRQWRNDADYLDDPPPDLALVVATALATAEAVFRSLTPSP